MCGATKLEPLFFFREPLNLVEPLNFSLEAVVVIGTGRIRSVVFFRNCQYFICFCVIFNLVAPTVAPIVAPIVAPSALPQTRLPASLPGPGTRTLPQTRLSASLPGMGGGGNYIKILDFTLVNTSAVVY